MITLHEAEKRAAESLNGFPPEVISSYLSFAGKGDPADLDAVILGVLNFYLAKKPAERLVLLPGTTRLVEDLGCDSLTMIDMVFMVESLFDVKLDDAKLAKLTTLDDLRLYLRTLAGTPAAS
jgi:3-hydroxyacyl-[acyl-carrier-protein] dehydratase